MTLDFAYIQPYISSLKLNRIALSQFDRISVTHRASVSQLITSAFISTHNVEYCVISCFTYNFLFFSYSFSYTGEHCCVMQKGTIYFQKSYRRCCISTACRFIFHRSQQMRQKGVHNQLKIVVSGRRSKCSRPKVGVACSPACGDFFGSRARRRIRKCTKRAHP